MKLEFDYRGQTHQLVKHSTVRQSLKRGEITEEQARRKAWYYRANWRPTRPYKLSHDDAAAEREAKDMLRGRATEPGKFAAWCAAEDAKKGVTIGDLADKWIAAGLPFSKTNPRSNSAAAEIQTTLTKALEFWRPKRAANIARTDHDDFVVYRRANNKLKATSATAGSRSADKQLGAMSSLCQWAVRESLIEKNPFEDRETYQKDGDVKHCHQFAPESDEEFHRMLHWFFTSEINTESRVNNYTPASRNLLTRIAGAWLAFTALTGLRPEEPAFLYCVPRLQTPATRPQNLPPGTIFPDRNGALNMKVVRSKHGQNPYVLLHPVLLDFLDTWTAWLDAQPQFNQITTGRHLFPDPADPTKSFCNVTIENSRAYVDTTFLNKRLNLCCAALKLEQRKPKGMGRAFFVAVSRSQGDDDAVIAGKLGQTTDGELIRDTYGDPDAMHGGKMLDWKPEAPAELAWTALRPPQQTNIVNVAFGK